ncbi:hypothetical protein ABQX22_26400, partial [Xanthomonas sp. WHRI 1810A]|uniref:hypothetical protein n=1 Tax=Xanthomonas sp. WHRI 1810A TaxID=3161565 RepID=UPI0032E90881
MLAMGCAAVLKSDDNGVSGRPHLQVLLALRTRSRDKPRSHAFGRNRPGALRLLIMTEARSRPGTLRLLILAEA